MIKTPIDLRRALDKMIKERGYGSKGHIQADTGADDISVSSPATSATVGEISVGAIFIPPRSENKGGKNKANN